MKRLAIDARLYSQTGVGTYLRNLLKHLPEFLPKTVEVTVYLHESDRSKARDLPYRNVRFISIPWHSFAEQTQLYRELMGASYDLVHFPYFSYPVLYTRPFLATIHDITPLLFRTGKASTKHPLTYALKHAVFSHVLKTQAFNARAIITPTKTVRNQLCNLYPQLPSSKILPIYEGVDEGLLAEKSDFTKAESIPSPYILYVGNFYPHKNIELLVEAWSQFDSSFTLVCAGPDDFFRGQIEKKARSMKLENKIVFIKNSTRAQLKGLYEKASALIHPSRSEGFGLPIVEAMHFKLPVIASDIPVFRELLDSQYYAFDPSSKESMVQAFEKWHGSKDKPDYEKRLSNFSFQLMARETAALYVKHLS